MKNEITKEVREEISSLISSDSSPVGIDAKETHIIIIHKLLQIEERLIKIEQRIG